MKHYDLKNRITAFLLCLLMLALVIMPAFSAMAEQTDRKVVRVGWYESPFNTTGTDGSRSGYAYEYQQKIAAYTGWIYEYVEGSWVELLQMVQNGELDLMTDVSYTEERAQTMLYSDLPMGTEDYYLYVAGGNTSITPRDLTTLSGKKIAVNEGSFQKMLLESWASEKNLEIDIVGLNLGYLEAWELILDGTYDGYVTMDSYSGNGDRICKIGSSDFYFVMNSGCGELVNELNAALDAIQSENRYYNQQLWDKYLGNQGASRYLSVDELNWLNAHGTIRVGYRNNYMPFCGTDAETGMPTGMLKDYFDEATTLFRNADISFQFIAYSSTQAAKDALKRGEIDCTFPVNMSLSEAEEEQLIIFGPIVETQMDMLVSKANYSRINLSGKVRIALMQGNTGFLRLINEYFPNGEIVYFANTIECLKGIARGEADGIIVNPHQISNVSRYLDEYQLVAINTDAISDMSFILNVGDTELYSILNKIQNLISDASVQSMILQNTKIDNTVTFIDFVKAYFAYVLVGCALVAAALVFLLLKSRRAEKAARLAQQQTAEANTEIQEINGQLEEHQAQLEELTAEQKSQIEEIQQLNQELLVTKNQAEAANHAKTVFLNNMSHDIRTPMNAILGFGRLIEKEGPLSAQQAEYLRKIETSGEYLLSVINNVLDMARIESGKMELDEVFDDLLDPVNKTDDMLTSEYMKKELKYTSSIDIRHRYVFADTAKTRQVTMNILSNAIKYTPVGGSIHCDFREIPCDREGYARYVTTISDTGIGMSKEFQEHLFESFSRERTSSANTVLGTGLGMSIVKRLVDLMGGTVEVKSELGKGTTFIVTVDFRIVPNPELYLKKKPSAESDNVDLHGRRILLAEDNELNAEIATAILEETGAEIERAADGVICVDMLKKAEPGYYDLILMDIQMPNMNGYEAADKIRRMGFGIPILAMTANVFAEDKIKALEAGMNGHLAKPINVPELMKALAEFLG